jgi:hypothetical protein
MANRRPLNSEDKLAALRKADPARRWLSLDDRCTCVLCERTFNGRQIDVAISAAGRVRLRCPSEGCTGTPREWVHPGNPLVSQKAWRDWERVLGAAKSARRSLTKPTKQILGATA